MEKNRQGGIEKTIEQESIIYSLNLQEKKAKIIGYNKSNGKITIPRIVKYESTEYIITSISSYAFRYTQIDWLCFSDESEIEIIENRAFGNANIQRFTIPPHLTKICEYAFYSCKRLKIIEIPPKSELKTIEKYSFAFSSIESFTIPENLIDLQKEWCYGTPKLTEIYVSPKNPRYITYDDGKIILGKSSFESENYDNLVFCVRNIKYVTIPSFIEHICDYAFENCDQLQKVIFPSDSKLQTIGKSAFSHSSIESFTIPSSLKIIKEYAFNECNKLRNIENPMNSELQIIEEKAFANTSIENFTISSQLKKISCYSFINCKKLQKIEVTENSELKTIDKEAFHGTSIDSFTIPSSAVDLKEGWFCHSLHLTTINVSSDNHRYKSFEGKMIIGKSCVEEEVYDTIIFCNRNVLDINIPSYIKYIAAYSFSHCYYLRKIEIQSDSKLQVIEKYAFHDSSIESFTIPQSLTTIGEYAFAECTKLKKIQIPFNSKLQVINKRAFSLSLITSIVIPHDLTHLGLFVFFRNPFLQIIEIQNISIKNMIFDRLQLINEKVVKIMIPNNVH